MNIIGEPIEFPSPPPSPGSPRSPGTPRRDGAAGVSRQPRRRRRRGPPAPLCGRSAPRSRGRHPPAAAGRQSPDVRGSPRRRAPSHLRRPNVGVHGPGPASNSSVIGPWPAFTACMRAVHPRSSRPFTSAPAASRAFSILMSPAFAARCRASPETVAARRELGSGAAAEAEAGVAPYRAAIRRISRYASVVGMPAEGSPASRRNARYARARAPLAVGRSHRVAEGRKQSAHFADPMRRRWWRRWRR